MDERMREEGKGRDEDSEERGEKGKEKKIIK